MSSVALKAYNTQPPERPCGVFAPRTPHFSSCPLCRLMKERGSEHVDVVLSWTPAEQLCACQDAPDLVTLRAIFACLSFVKVEAPLPPPPRTRRLTCPFIRLKLVCGLLRDRHGFCRQMCSFLDVYVAQNGLFIFSLENVATESSSSHSKQMLTREGSTSNLWQMSSELPLPSTTVGHPESTGRVLKMSENSDYQV